METIEIKVIGIYQDGGDGGGTFEVYRDRDHYIEATSRYNTPEQAAAQFDRAEKGDSPYEDGELVEAIIQLEKVGTEWRLAKDFSLHWGQ